MAQYQYTPIDLEGPSFRLVRVLKGYVTESDIRCKLIDAYLTDGEAIIPYSALSYTWGNPCIKQDITVDGRPLGVTQNLYTALRNLRLEDTDRILWVDAICINQSNVNERGHQVQHMGKIYQEAESVIIWLEEATFNTDRAMDLIERLQTQQRMNSEAGGGRLPWGDLANHWTSDEKQILLEGMSTLLSRSWFRRIWILQEVAFARVAWIVSGRKTVSARIFALIPSLIDLSVNAQSQAVLDIMPGFSREKSWWSQNRDLYTLLKKFKNSESSDRRDKIFALQGMSSDAYDGISLPINYGQSPLQVVKKTAEFIWSRTDFGQVYALGLMMDTWSVSELPQNLDDYIRLFQRARENQSTTLLISLLQKRVYGFDDNHPLHPSRVRSEQKFKKIVTALLAENDFNQGELRFGFDGSEHGDQSLETWQTMLLRASRNGQEALVDLLLCHTIGAPDGASPGRFPWSPIPYIEPLRYAAMNGHPAVVKLLLNAGAYVDSKQAEYGVTPLWYAALNGHVEVVQLLLDRGAEVDIIGRRPPGINVGGGFHDSEYGATPLWHAARKGNVAVVKLLQRKRANPNAKIKVGKKRTTPLEWAEANNKDMVDLLLNFI